MPPHVSDAILQALAPGVALNSAILFNTTLQNRFMDITSRARALNREARELGAAATPDEARYASVRAQVNSMTIRARTVRQASVVLYSAVCSFILTIFSLLLGSIVTLPGENAIALVFFGLGFLFLVAATLLSLAELGRSQRTLDEDIRSSFSEGTGGS